jgi:threonine/homoserine/homoserine lactone efflux protein
VPEADTILIVALASLLLVVLPGPAVIYILTRSVSQGRTAGLVSAVGVNLGSTIHVLASVGGLSLLLANSANAYTIIRWLGVAYLAWIGVSTLTSSDAVFETPSVDERSLRRILGQGVLVNVLNPKVAIFFLAFLPQFVDQGAGNPAFQTFVLGMVLVFIGFVSDSVYAIVGGGIGDVLRSRKGVAKATRITAGVTYLSLAGIAAISGIRSS